MARGVDEVGKTKENISPGNISPGWLRLAGGFFLLWEKNKKKGPLFYPGKYPAADPFEEGQSIPLV